MNKQLCAVPPVASRSEPGRAAPGEAEASHVDYRKLSHASLPVASRSEPGRAAPGEAEASHVDYRKCAAKLHNAGAQRRQRRAPRSGESSSYIYN